MVDKGLRISLTAHPTLGVIMGGGAGTRLYPLTKDRAKPAVPLGGKYRLVDIPISNCLNAGIRKIFLLTQFNSSSLHRHIQRTYKFEDFSRGFVEVLAARQTTDKMAGWYQGTADAVRQNLVHFDSEDHQLVLILSGDQLYRMDFRDVISQHLQLGSDLTVATIPVDRAAARGFGIMHIDQENRITRFVEKPKEEKLLDSLRLNAATRAGLSGAGAEDLYLASMGIYVFNRKTLREALDNDRVDFGKDVIPDAISRHRVHAYVYQGYWEDIGTIKAFYHANLDLCSPSPQFDFFDQHAPVYTRPRYLPGTKIERCVLERTVIADGSIVADARIANCLIGLRTIVGKGAIVEDSVVMGADFYEQEHPMPGAPPLGIGEGSVVRRAIVDKNVRIGRNCRVSPEGKPAHADHALYHIRDGIIVVPKNTVIPDGTIL